MAIPWGTGALTPSISGRYAHSKGESASRHLWDGLVGSWAPALGPTGAMLRDLSGQNRHGTLSVATWGVGAHGAVLVFAGTAGETLSCGNVPALYTPPLTVVAYAQAVSARRQPLVCWGIDRPACELAYGAANRPILFLGSGNYRYWSNNTPVNTQDGGWHHWAFRITGNAQADIEDASLYVDGKAQAVVSTSATTVWDTVSRCEWGSNGNYNYRMQGSLAYCAIHRGILPASTIRDLAADPLAPLRLRRQVYYSVPAVVAGGNPWYYYAQQGAAVA